LFVVGDAELSETLPVLLAFVALLALPKEPPQLSLKLPLLVEAFAFMVFLLASAAFQTDYMIENRPIANPPGAHRVVEELKSVEETTALIHAQNGDAYCPGSYHNYLGVE
jgi:hypothetical protein